MPTIPNQINGVRIRFAQAVNRDVDQKVINGLRRVIKPNIASGHTLRRVYISSANDQHQLPSRHMQGDGKAVDISRINGMKMSLHYGSNAAVTAIVDAMQREFESYTPHRRENFGPAFDRKLGRRHPVPGHQDHIHFSVN